LAPCDRPAGEAASAASHKKTAVVRVEGGAEQAREEVVIAEAPLQILINQQPFTITMRTPGADRELAAGLLFSEGIIQFEPGVFDLQLPELNQANIDIPEVYLCEGMRDSRTLASTASCGLCGLTHFVSVEGEALGPLEIPFSVSSIPALYDAMHAHQKSFSVTGGCHAAAVSTHEGTLLACFEDVGRHNAVDKCLGDLLIRDQVDSAEILAVSSRVSYEIVAKCYRAGIRVLCAVSAPTSLAIETAERLGISLLGFCREDRATIYTHAQNIKV
jgi:FdhD protein